MSETMARLIGHEDAGGSANWTRDLIQSPTM